MMYPYMTLNDDTEITHSEMFPDGRVKVYIETPDAEGGFYSAICYLPTYQWEDIQGYSETEMEHFKQLIRDNTHLILKFTIRDFCVQKCFYMIKLKRKRTRWRF